MVNFGQVVTGQKRDKIRELLLKGNSYSEIVKTVRCSKAAIAYHAKRIGMGRPGRKTFDWKEIQAFYDAGNSREDCIIRFGFSKAAWNMAVNKRKLKPRDHIIPLNELLVIGRRTNRTHLKTRLFKTGHLENRCYECGISS